MPCCREDPLAGVDPQSLLADPGPGRPVEVLTGGLRLRELAVGGRSIMSG
jgi:hypothetical protein